MGQLKNLEQRTNARLLAVQALYQQEFSKQTAASVMTEFLQHRAPAELVDTGLFQRLVKLANAEKAQFTQMIESNLAAGWTLARIDTVLKPILLAGIAEIVGEAKTPIKVVLSEYVHIARSFFMHKEPAFVNSLLDKIARLVRPHDFNNDLRPHDFNNEVRPHDFTKNTLAENE